MSEEAAVDQAATVVAQQLIRSAEDIAGMERQMLQPGVDYTMLWREGRSAAGLMFIEPGANVAEHVHEAATHQVWVVDGIAVVDGRPLGPGSYVQIPAGVPHAVETPATEGCTLFYLYLRSSS